MEGVGLGSLRGEPSVKVACSARTVQRLPLRCNAPRGLQCVGTTKDAGQLNGGGGLGLRGAFEC